MSMSTLTLTDDFVRLLGGREGRSPAGYAYWDFVYDSLPETEFEEGFETVLRVHSRLSHTGESIVELCDSKQLQRGIGLTKHWPKSRAQLLALLRFLNVTFNDPARGDCHDVPADRQ